MMETRPTRADPAGGLSVFGAGAALLKHPRVLVGAPLAGIILGLLAGMLQGPQFVATSTFFPESGPQRLPAGLSGLASQFGFALAGGSDSRSIDFYASLLKSEHLLSEVLQRPMSWFRDGGDTTASLLDRLAPTGETQADRLQAAVVQLGRQVFVGTDARAGVVRLRTVAQSRAFAEGINRALLTQVNAFNLDRRRTVAAAERQFVEERLEEARRGLRQAEDDMAAFLEANRLYEQDPRLRNQAARLQRAVDLQQQVVQALAQAFEQARVEEVRNTPVITVVDPPEGTGRPSSRLVLLIILGAFLGGALGLAGAAGLELLQQSRNEHPEAFTEFERLRRSLVRRMLRRGAADARTGPDGSRRPGTPA